MKFKIAIIGAGRISYSLAAALIKAEYSVVSVISTNKKSAEKLARKFNIKSYSDKLADIPGLVNMFLLTVPDGEIKKVAGDLARQKLIFKKSYFIHYSGSENISSLKVLKTKGATIASIHLMHAFSSKRIMKIQNVPAAIEASSNDEYKIFEKFALSLKLFPFKIESKYKSYYHLAGVFSLNFLAGNLYSAKQMLSMNSIDELEYLKNFSSTLNSLIQNIEKVGAANTLSGPVDRGEYKTVKKHIEAIKKLCNKPGGNKFRLMLKNYIIQSLNLLYLVEEKHGQLKSTHVNIKELLLQELTKLEKSS
jgi:predicted short-subunit dehydrogenase-like oxidoreductase (DUF2520 family)